MIPAMRRTVERWPARRYGVLTPHRRSTSSSNLGPPSGSRHERAPKSLLCASTLPAKLTLVDDVIAVRVTLADGGERYFLTWGRIQDVIDSAPVSALVL